MTILNNSSSILDRFPLERRSVVANQFFTAAREGSTTVAEILRAVKADALRRTLTEEGERLEAQRLLLSLLESTEASAYAQEVINREALPSAERMRLKSERQEHYRREYLLAQKPTERQLHYLKSLGCSVPPTNRWEASVMIDGHIKR